MKIKKFNLFFILCLFIEFGVYSQNININFTNGTNNIYNLQDVRKITFSNNIMNLSLWDGTLFSWDINSINYYNYFEEIMSVENMINKINDQQIVLFPNPVNTELNLTINAEIHDDVSILLHDIKGEMILEKKLQFESSELNQTKFDLNEIPPGIYICRIVNKYFSVSKKVIKY